MAMKVRILRSRKSATKAAAPIVNLFKVAIGIFGRMYGDPDKERMQQARLAKVQMDTLVAEKRLQKLMNDLVIGDLKIEKMNAQNGHPIPPEYIYRGEDY